MSDLAVEEDVVGESNDAATTASQEFDTEHKQLDVTQPPPAPDDSTQVSSDTADVEATKTDYFTPVDEAVQDGISTENTTEPKVATLSGEIPILSPPATTPSNSESGERAQSPSTSQRKLPGWKGWLRSASSTNVNLFRTDSGRKGASPAMASRPQSTITLGKSLDQVKEDLAGDPSIDWTNLEVILRSEAPRRLLETTEYIKSGMPNHLRSILWQTAAQSKNLDLENVFVELKADSTVKTDKQIAKDLQRMNKTWLKLLE